MNHIKNTQTYPEAIDYCNITSLYKHKGSHRDFNNYRGVFRVTVQVQVQDAEKCFDKLWLQCTTNALFKAGLNNDMLNLLYLENLKAKVAIKINNGITERVPVKNVEMQGSVWGSLKCTSSMDILNKNILEQKDLVYNYRGDPNIEIGVLGMVDDNLSISKCGTSSVMKNGVINSFIEMQRLTLSREKSVVLHIGKETKCKISCPTLKVHKYDMKVVGSQRYLGDIISSSGTLKETIEDRRAKGWGKISDITGILSEMPNSRKIEIGLKMRDAKLLNGMIYSSEAWSKISD